MEPHVDDGSISPRVSRRSFLSTLSAATIPASAIRALSTGQITDAKKSVTVHVDFTPQHVINSFDPDQALGSSMDILPQGVVDKIYTDPIIKQSLSAGSGPITYRQNTELRIAAWHWNHNGAWSSPETSSGYFTGRSDSTEFLRHSYAYPLPRRGTTRNGGTESGYSRITDGDPATYWKSNPYLTRTFTGEDDALHPQWVVLDLASEQQVTALRIDWGHPYAQTYEIQFWTGQHAMDAPISGVWNLFPNGAITNGHGGTAFHELAQSPVITRFLRVWMTGSSNTYEGRSSGDLRDRLGFAIHEMYAGTLTGAGQFLDLVRHSPDQSQTATYCSSIDPWHTAADLDLHMGDQTGFDLFFTSGITNNLPAMIPVSVLYGTPDDSATQIAYLKHRGYRISYIEMGEEPDGQYILPEDYGALYVQWAAAIHRVDPDLKLGGPAFEGVNEDIKTWPDAQGRTSWLGRFIDYLKSRGRLSDLAFMSFEHYPFPPCTITWPDLYREPDLMSHILQVWREAGLPQNVPMFVTESNIAAALTHEMVELLAALWLADNVGSFFAAGGNAFYHSPIQPEPLRKGCHGWSTYGNFVADEAFHIKQYTSQYFAGRLINLEWVKHGAGTHRMFPAVCDAQDEAGHTLVTIYALERPDGGFSLLLVNRDPSNRHSARIVFSTSDGTRERWFSGPVVSTTFGADQYSWRGDGPNAHPSPDGPLLQRTFVADSGTIFTLPKASITVLRGNIEK